MVQKGIIVKNSGKKAKVLMQRHASCAGCNACKMGSSEEEMEVEALNPHKIKKGRRVEVEMPNQGLLTASFLMYVVPLIFLMIGVTLGTYGLPVLGIEQYQDHLTVVIALGLTAFSYWLLNRYGKKHGFKEDMFPVIRGVVEENEEPCEINTKS